GVDRQARTPLVLLLSVTGLVLLIACANIANLLLARSAARAGEMAVRLSIGATRGQLIAQLLTESCLLAVCGGIAGVAVARWTLDFIVAMLPSDAASSLAFHIDTVAILFAAGLSIGTGVLFGLFPALHSTRPDLVSALKGQAGQPSGARSAARFRLALATMQIGLSMFLLVGAGLFTKSLMNVSRVDLGIKADNVITFAVSPELNGYKPAASRALFERLEGDLGAVPGVTAVTTAIVPLLAGNNWGNNVTVEGFPAGPDTDTNSRYNEIGPSYFRGLGVPLLAGREFTASDGATAPKVAIVNEAFAKKFNLGRNAVGKRMSQSSGKDAKLDIEIVGLAENAKYSDVKDPTPPVFFIPYRQDPTIGFMVFYVRTGLEPAQFFGTIRQVVAKADPNLPIENLRTLPEQIRQNVFLDRMITTLSVSFAALATLLAAIGLYGVIAYTVSQRTREIGLRMALGAAPARVRAMVMRQVAIMTAIGGVCGLVLAVWMGYAAQSLLYQLQGWDPVVLAGAAAALTIVALGAGIIPAHRASRVDPML
ncbi:MAG: FtsX-like permease family protein, partial [Casimicrobiaceae bacterium]